MYGDVRRRLSLDAAWAFYRGDASGAEAPGYDDSAWRVLDLPHDWSIELAYNPESPAGRNEGYLDGGVGWYRKTFDVPADFAGRKVLIEFGGISMNSDVWLNGHHLGHRPYGYSTFFYDLSPYLNSGGANVLAVRADHPQPAARWYCGSGIYRRVWLHALNPVHIAPWGLFVHASGGSSRSAAVSVTCELVNQSAAAVQAAVLTTILSADGSLVATDSSDTITLSAGGQATLSQTLAVADPQLWSPDSPYLYQALSQVMVSGVAVDACRAPLGICYLDFDADKGMSLNGRPIKIKGVCLHDDLGALGAAFNYRAYERRVEILKEMGCNAIRTAHNPPAPELLEICDRLGMMVKEEAFDAWQVAKVPYDYHLHFAEWAETDIKAMVRRDRNHPSVIMWSIGNEIVHPTVEAARKLKTWVCEEDPSRPVTWASNGMAGREHQTVTDLLDLAGYNYGVQFYDDDHKKYPQRKIFGSETGAARHQRGLFLRPAWHVFYPNQPDLGSGYDNYLSKWGRLSAREDWYSHAVRDFVAGEFIWTGFDYPGENDWPVKSNNDGSIDTCGFPKDTYYFYQSQWRQEPMVHILPHWNWQPGETLTIFAYTNCESVELFLNGESLGTQHVRPGRDLHLEWDVPFRPGTLRAEGRRSGLVAATAEVKTAGEPAAVKLTVDRGGICADGQDLAFVTTSIVDAAGVEVPMAKNLVEYELAGPAWLRAVDNGDPVSHESYQANSRRAYAGKSLAIVQAGRQAGETVITARSAELASDSLVIWCETAN